MASMWRRAMVYLGLQDDDELDYGGDYEPYGDYADATRDPRAGHTGLDDYEDGDDTGRRAAGADRSARSDSGTVRATRDYGPEPPPTTPRPSVVRTIGPTTAARVHVVEPSGFGDAPEVGDRLKANQPVILNLQGVSRDLQRRVIDFSSGVAYGVSGSISRVADQVFLLTPSNIEVSQEEKERLQARGLYRV